MHRKNSLHQTGDRGRSYADVDFLGALTEVRVHRMKVVALPCGQALRRPGEEVAHPRGCALWMNQGVAASGTRRQHRFGHTRRQMGGNCGVVGIATVP